MTVYYALLMESFLELGNVLGFVEEQIVSIRAKEPDELGATSTWLLDTTRRKALSGWRSLEFQKRQSNPHLD